MAAKARRDRTVVAIADLHCGHRAGLIPPSWQYSPIAEDPTQAKWGKIQEELWSAYSQLASEYKKPDLLIVNGDLIDGPGPKSGGTEQVTTDLQVQCEMARIAIELWEPKRVIASYGTPYHAGFAGQDWEKLVIRVLGDGAEIHSHPFIEVNGVMFDVRHYGGRPQLPYNKGTSLGKQWLYNLLWSIREEQPRAGVILRAHIHNAGFVGGYHPDWVAFFQPGLQAAGTIYSGRQCSNTVDWGIIAFSVSPTGTFAWDVRVAALQANRTEAICLT